MAISRFFAKRICIRSSKCFLGTADASIWESFKQELKDKQIHYEIIYSDDHIVNFVLLFLRAEQEEVQELVRQFSILPLRTIEHSFLKQNWPAFSGK